MSIRSQIYDKLAADAPLMALLAQGTQSIIDESDLTSETPAPCITIRYSGPHPHQDIPEFDIELWEIKCFDRAEAYYNIERIIENVRRVLHRAQLTINDDGISSGLEIEYLWKQRTRFDPTFREESMSAVFRVPVLYSS